MLEGVLKLQGEEAIWPWGYNHGKAYPMPCKKCRTLAESEQIGYRNGVTHIRCSHCGYEQQIGLDELPDCGMITVKENSSEVK